jgi:hypothetical protein
VCLDKEKEEEELRSGSLFGVDARDGRGDRSGLPGMEEEAGDDAMTTHWQKGRVGEGMKERSRETWGWITRWKDGPRRKE